MVSTLARPDDVVEEADPEDLAGVAEPLGHVVIFAAWSWISGRMIVQNRCPLDVAVECSSCTSAGGGGVEDLATGVRRVWDAVRTDTAREPSRRLPSGLTEPVRR